MVDHDHITPQLAAKVGEGNPARGDAVNVLAQIGFSGAEAAPIFGSVDPVAVLLREGNGDVPARVGPPGSLFLVRPFAVSVANGEIKAVGRGKLGF
jgi:hypothetical protein